MLIWWGILRRAIFVLAVTCMLMTTLPAHPGSGIAVDRPGQVFFLDTGSGLWKIDTKGGLTHLSLLRNHWLAIDANNGFTQARLPTDPGRDWVITSISSNPTLLISTDFPITIGQDGNLYYPTVRQARLQIMRAKPSGETSVFVTLPNASTGAPLPHLNGITAAPDGSIYYTEDDAIRRIDAKGNVSTVARVTALVNDPLIPGIEKRPYLRGLNVDAKGVMYVADNGDARVLKITPEGKISALVQLQSPWSPTAVALYGDVLYVLEFLHTPGDDRTTWMPRIRKITPDGKSTVILTVDQMPGARPKPVTKVAGFGFENLFHWEFLNPFLGGSVYQAKF